MDSSRHFSEEEIQMANDYMKMPVSSAIKGNATQNAREVPFHTHHAGYNRKEWKTTSVGKDVYQGYGFPFRVIKTFEILQNW